MAARTRAGVPGTETPRAKDMPAAGGSGKKATAPGKKQAATEGEGKLARAAIKKALMAFLSGHGATQDVCARWKTEFAAFCRGLPSQSASVWALVADRTRNAYLAEYYSLEARSAGVNTTAGAKLAGMAHGCDMHVQRFSLHARDLAYREAGYSLDGTNGAPVGVSLDDVQAALDAAKAADAAASSPDARVELLARLNMLADRVAHQGLFEAQQAVAAPPDVVAEPATVAEPAPAPVRILGPAERAAEAAARRRLRVVASHEKALAQWDEALERGDRVNDGRTGVLGLLVPKGES